MENQNDIEKNRFRHSLGMGLDYAVTQAVQYSFSALSVVSMGFALSDPTPLHSVYAVASIIAAVHTHDVTNNIKDAFVSAKNELGELLVRVAESSRDPSVAALLVGNYEVHEIVDRLKENAPAVFNAIKNEPWSTHECVLEITNEIATYGAPSLSEQIQMITTGESLIDYRNRTRFTEQEMSC